LGVNKNGKFVKSNFLGREYHLFENIKKVKIKYWNDNDEKL